MIDGDWETNLRKMPLNDVQTHADRLAESVADAIIAGTLHPGSRLDEHGLAGRYGVSRTPVREALRQLAAMGLVEIRPRRGAVVASLNPSKLEMLFAAMAEIEATCARLCALGMTPVERRRLQAFHQSMGDFVAAGDTDAYSEANQSFHSRIYEGAHNEVIAEMAVTLRRRLLPFRKAQFRTPGRLPKSHSEHEAVVDAILAADAAKAHSAMLYHVSLVEDAYEELASLSAA